MTCAPPTPRCAAQVFRNVCCAWSRSSVNLTGFRRAGRASWRRGWWIPAGRPRLSWLRTWDSAYTAA